MLRVLYNKCFMCLNLYLSKIFITWTFKYGDVDYYLSNHALKGVVTILPCVILDANSMGVHVAVE